MHPRDFDLGQLFWRSREAIIVADADSNQIVLWNPNAEALFGYTVDEAVGQAIDMLVPQRLRARYQAALAQYQAMSSLPVIDTGRAIEVPMLRKSGEELPVELTLSPVEALSSAGRFMLVVIRDASDRRRAARERERRARGEFARTEAEASRQRLLNLIEGLSAILFETDLPSGRFRFVSHQVESLLGYPAQRWLDDPDFWLSLTVPEDREQAETIAQSVIADGQSRQLEMRVTAADGHPVVLRGTLDVGRTADGEPELVRGVLLDVTEQKRGEQALHFVAAASAALASASDAGTLLQSLVQLAVPAVADYAMVHIVDADGAISRTARTHIDSRRQAEIDAMRELYPLDPAGPHPIAQVIRSGTPVFVPQASDAFYTSFAQDGEHLAYLRQIIGSYIVVPLAVRGRRIGALTFMRTGAERPFSQLDYALALDLAHRAALAIDTALLYEAERAARTEAETALAARDQFLSVASHELRTPLATVKASLQIIAQRLTRGGTVADLSALLELVDTGMDRLTRLVTDLLDVSRITQDGFAVTPKPLELRPFIERLIELERATSPPRTIEFSCADDLPVVMADPGRLEQVLDNLLVNARKYSPQGTPIGVHMRARDGRVSIAVCDHGIGIPPEEQSRIFERFHRASNVDTGISGLGIGLYIAHELVRAHGGELRVESEAGAGSTFTIVLPLQAQQLRRNGAETV